MMHAVNRVANSSVIGAIRASSFFVVPASSWITRDARSTCRTRMLSNSSFRKAKVYGGFRPEEVFRMRWEDVNFRPAGKALYGYVHVPIGKTKCARRNVSMTARVKVLLEMRHAGQGQPSEGWVFPAATKSGRVESLKSQHRKALKLSNPNRDSWRGELALANIPVIPMRFDKLRHCFERTFKASQVMLVASGFIRELALQLGKQCFIDEVPRRHSISPVASTHPYRTKIPLSCKTSALKRRGGSLGMRGRSTSLTALLGNCTVHVTEMESLCPPRQPRGRMAR